MAIPEPQAYYYSTVDSTSNVSYLHPNRTYIVRSYTNYDSCVTANETEVKAEQEGINNWAELRRHFTGFKAKRMIKLNGRYVIRQPSKCHRNIRRERIQRFMKKL